MRKVGRGGEKLESISSSSVFSSNCDYDREQVEITVVKENKQLSCRPGRGKCIGVSCSS